LQAAGKISDACMAGGNGGRLSVRLSYDTCYNYFKVPVAGLVQVVFENVHHHSELAEQHHPVASSFELGQQAMKNCQLACKRSIS
jgi:hypothetical protein